MIVVGPKGLLVSVVRILIGVLYASNLVVSDGCFDNDDGILLVQWPTRWIRFVPDRGKIGAGDRRRRHCANAWRGSCNSSLFFLGEQRLNRVRNWHGGLGVTIIGRSKRYIKRMRIDFLSHERSEIPRFLHTNKMGDSFVNLFLWRIEWLTGWS